MTSFRFEEKRKTKRWRKKTEIEREREKQRIDEKEDDGCFVGDQSRFR